MSIIFSSDMPQKNCMVKSNGRNNCTVESGFKFYYIVSRSFKRNSDLQENLFSQIFVSFFGCVKLYFSVWRMILRSLVIRLSVRTGIKKAFRSRQITVYICFEVQIFLFSFDIHEYFVDDNNGKTAAYTSKQ